MPKNILVFNDHDPFTSPDALICLSTNGSHSKGHHFLNLRINREKNSFGHHISQEEGGWLKHMGFCISMRQSHKNKSYPKSRSHRQWTIAIGSHTSTKTGWFRRTWSPFLQTVQRRSHGLAFLIRMRQLYISLCLVVIIVELYSGMQSRDRGQSKKKQRYMFEYEVVS